MNGPNTIIKRRCGACQQPKGSRHAAWCEKVGGSGIRTGAGFVFHEDGTVHPDGSVGEYKLPSPSKDEQKHPLFLAIYHALKTWDIRTEFDSGYCGGNGSHAMLIFNALRDELAIQIAAIDLGTREPPR